MVVVLPLACGLGFFFFFFEDWRSWPDGDEKSEFKRDFSELERFIPLAGWINEKPRCTGRAKPQNSCHTHGPLLRSFHPQTLAGGSSRDRKSVV